MAYADARTKSAPAVITPVVSSANVDGAGSKRAPGPIGVGVFDDAFSSDDDVARAYVPRDAKREAKEPMAILIQCVKAFAGNMSFASANEALRARERTLLLFFLIFHVLLYRFLYECSKVCPLNHPSSIFPAIPLHPLFTLTLRRRRSSISSFAFYAHPHPLHWTHVP